MEQIPCDSESSPNGLFGGPVHQPFWNSDCVTSPFSKLGDLGKVHILSGFKCLICEMETGALSLQASCENFGAQDTHNTYAVMLMTKVPFSPYLPDLVCVGVV